MENNEIPAGTIPGRTTPAGTAAAGTTPAGTFPGITDPPQAVLPPASASRFELRRSRTDRMLGGVCGGLAAGLGVDAALLRVLAVALTLVTGGAAAIVYIAAWALAPVEDRPAY